MNDEQRGAEALGSIRVLERHIQSLALVALLSVSAWNALTSHDTAVNVAEMSARLEANELQQTRRDRQLESLEARIRELERELQPR